MPNTPANPRNAPIDRVAYAVVLGLCAFVRPRWAVLQQHRAGYGLIWAWLVAGLSVATVAVVLPALTDWTRSLVFDGFSSPLPLILSNASLVLRDFTWSFSDPPELARLTVLILTGHGLWVIVAWAHLAWCAQPGTPAEALRLALRAVSWASPAAVLVFGVAGVADAYWQAKVDVYFGALPGTAMMYSITIGEPWWVVLSQRSELLLFTLACLVAYPWFTAATRAMPWPARCVWPPRCCDCGYSLQGVDPSGDCPECGYPVPKSLRPDNIQAAAPLHTPAPLAACAVWLQHGWSALLRPHRLGRGVPLYTLNAGHASSRWITGIVLFLTGLLGVSALRLILGHHKFVPNGLIAPVTGPVLSYAVVPTLVTLSSLIVMQVTATVATAAYTRKVAGTTLPAAAALASFGSLYLVFANAVLWATACLLVTGYYTIDHRRYLSPYIWYEYAELSPMVMAIVAALLWTGYASLIGRALRAARYNNH
ncbi:MAG: hypothetical protein AAF797_15450 [Planctomycetota bacterium]